MSSRPREIWVSAAFVPLDEIAARAAWYERLGFDGITVMDSQSLSCDPYVTLAVVATATTRLRLATGVTNPYTRHPMVTAAAAASLQRLSKGRAVLGIGRGNASLAHLGLAPAPPQVIESYLSRVQRYLAGRSVAFTEENQPPEMASLDVMKLAGSPESSRIAWLPDDQPKVEVDLAASGPKVIAIGARKTERITFAVNASPSRIRWAIDLARAAEPERRDAGRLSLGANVNVVAHDDLARARRLVAGPLIGKARFSVMYGVPQGPTSSVEDHVLRHIHATYDMTRHAQEINARTAALSDEYIDSSAILGSNDYCAERLRALFDLGLDRVVIGGLSPESDPQEINDVWQRLAEEVMPLIRQ